VLQSCLVFSSKTVDISVFRPLCKIRRDHFSPTKTTRVWICSLSFCMEPLQLYSTIPLYHYTNTSLPDSGMSEPQTAPDHDFPVTPATSVMAGEIAMSYDKLKKKVEELQHQLETVQLHDKIVSNNLQQGCQTQFLEGLSPAEFCSNPSPAHIPCSFQISLKDLIS
uniref:Uncharacterized protein n=2 Tax=Cyprinus carpio TaxID=7962 RepID=A0A9J8DCT6_CYPCA